MGREIICPGCGLQIAAPTSTASTEAATVARSVTLAAPTRLLPQEGDCPGLLQEPAHFAAAEADAGSLSVVDGLVTRSVPVPASTSDPGFESIDPLATLAADPILDQLVAAMAPGRPQSASEAIDTSSLPLPAPAAEADRPGSRAATGLVRPSTPARGLGQVVLASYASALTLALGWLIWNGALNRPMQVVDRSGSVDSAASAATPIRVAPGLLAVLGQSLRVGELEWQPLNVRFERPALVTEKGRPRRTIESESLALRVRVRNLSQSARFAPLDPAFVRTPDQGPPESGIEAGDRQIGPYPLAVQSDWRIRGESFEPLAPGEERTLLFFSEPIEPSELSPRMLWRLRVRVRTGQTELLGVPFQAGDIRPAVAPAAIPATNPADGEPE